jgi:peptide/nickel transport system permease protein
MLEYILKRILLLFPVMAVISIVIFFIIQLPPGDYLSSYIANLEQQGIEVTDSEAASLRRTYGLDKNIVEQYFQWISNIVTRGDFGRSFAWNKPVSALLKERVPMTIGISLATTIFIYMVSIPIGIYAATHQYSFFDYFWTFVGFIGLSVPGFLLALVVIWWTYIIFGVSISGLFSQEYIAEPWSIGKFIDMLKRIWFPMLHGSAMYSCEKRPLIETPNIIYVHHITTNANKNPGTESPIKPTNVQK